MNDQLRAGVEFFNNGHYFEAHEAFEDAWRNATTHKTCLQGLVQAAVALHHYASGNRIGAQSVLTRGIENLAKCPETFEGLEFPGLLEELKTASAHIAAGLDVQPIHIRLFDR